MGIITELLRGVVLVVEGTVCPNYQIHVHMGMDVSTSGPQVYGTCLEFKKWSECVEIAIWKKNVWKNNFIKCWKVCTCIFSRKK